MAEQLASDVADKALENPAQTTAAADELRESAPHDEEEEGEEEEEEEEDGDAQAGDGTVAKPKKKKKSKKKKKKTVDPTTAVAAAGTEPKVQDSSALPKPVPVHDINSLLQQLQLSQAGGNKKEGKAPEDYKFWNTQPVPKFKEPNLLQTTDGSEGKELPEGAILPDQFCKAAAKPEPEKLVDGFEWCLVDLDDKEELKELYDLLYNHYVEDTDGSFRFNYSQDFLAWSLKPPGWKKEWHIGVRTKSTAEGKKGKLVAFIAGIPVTLRVRSATLKATEINFLTIHRKLRSKRLAPVLIKEATRRCYLDGIYQALYTAGTLLPTPVSTCRYFHRSLDWEHLYNTGFSHLPPNSSVLRQRLKYKVEDKQQLKGLRLMKKEDVPAVKALLTKYLERFQLRQEFDEAEIEHWLCSETSKDVVWSYVLETDGKITDFMSYYLLESTVLRASKPETIRAAYLYYYATESAFPQPNKPKPKAADLQLNLQSRLQQLVHDALILAKKDNFHVFNALTLLDNPLFLKEEKFEPGDGKLHFYLFNWRTPKLPGGVNEANMVDAKRMGGVGVVML
ncbi:Glycylpeptide N-tetradecanoyltransferase [Teratosphaeria destructans]|uniref:Glycylpeptide N-tetradecanoyltransferase n=1 Tax=Teratosphaeria destructans TaxID=418781 RepID=A0A9W7W4S1_9PEZI|nr:Glycylpeptide N-tetradecanoyltransferase [Teratosphaeria destructans]